MNISIDDLYIEIGKMTAILRKYQEQVPALEARIVELENELAALTGKASE